MSYGVSGGVNDLYVIIISFVFLIFAFFNLKVWAFENRVDISDCISISCKLNSRISFMFVAFVVISLALQKGVGISYEHIKYLFGSSAFSYTEVRRELFSETGWASYSNLIRFSLVPVVFSMFFMSFLMGNIGKLRTLFFCFSLLVTCAIQLNKFFFLYFIMLIFILIINFKYKEGFETNRVLKLVPLGFVFVIAFGFGVMELYKFQYSSVLIDDDFFISNIKETLIFRVFFASSDALRLWIDYFLYESSPIGIASVGKICSLLDLDKCLNVNAHIPFYYHSRELTSMQVGFLGTALSFGGLYAIPLFITIVLIIITFINKISILLSKESMLLYITFNSQMFLNAFFITTRELHTAALSGGLVLVPLIYFLYLRRGLSVNFR
ncbi:hypothetical protein MSG34_13545 [Vibrio sp. 1CM2L]|uniref:hypothetical protein n=1 Tax=Vibrio sp. 1CM2L TaxID=2929166 RepID=UPI0020C0D6DE|nr:hypothetical protein [Vibrio sp. 1CM2L]MCK8077190.1 hypothetical protein [Vibrio sp. 1CM2L]